MIVGTTGSIGSSSGSSVDNQSIGRLTKQSIVSLNKWLKRLLHWMVGMPKTDRTRIDKDRWVEGWQDSINCRFDGNSWTTDHYMWTRYSLIHGIWLDLDTINKGPLGSVWCVVQALCIELYSWKWIVMFLSWCSMPKYFQ